MCSPLQNLEVNVCDVQQIYQLQCIIEHVGSDIGNGYYVSYFKTNDMWYCASDEDVSRISTENLPKQPYISLYKQTDAAPPSRLLPPSRPLSPPAPPSPEETDCEGTTNTTNADKSNDASQPARKCKFKSAVYRFMKYEKQNMDTDYFKIEELKNSKFFSNYTEDEIKLWTKNTPEFIVDDEGNVYWLH